MAIVFEVNPEKIMKEYSELNSLDFYSMDLRKIKKTYNRICELVKETKNTIKAFDILLHSKYNERDSSFRRKKSIKERKKPKQALTKLLAVFRPRAFDINENTIDGSYITYHSLRMFDTVYVRYNGEYVSDVNELKTRYVKILEDLRTLAKYIQQEHLNSSSKCKRVFLQRSLPLEY